MFLEFADLIKENSKKFTLEYPIPSGGTRADEYDDLGNPVSHENGDYLPPVLAEGALMPINVKLVYASGGTYTEADKTLYSLDHNIPEKTRIRYKNMVYVVGGKQDWEDYADFSTYSCKAVTAFD